VALYWSICHATEKHVGRALRIASVQRALRHAELLGADVVALERLGGDGDALRMRLATAGSAGNRASFGRPVTGAGATLRIK
jgi:hypothetical protein